MRLLVLSFIALIACSGPVKREILVPQLDPGFYSEALVKINNELKSDPSNDKLIEQKLFYCEQLDWPTTCVSALDKSNAKYGMTGQLVEQYIAYYEKHKRYRLLLDLIEKWNKEFDLEKRFEKSFIISLVNVKETKRAKIALRNYAINNQEEDDLEFIAQQYLTLRDTTLAAYTLSKLHSKRPNHELSYDYGRLLVSIGYVQKGFNILEQFPLDALERSLEVARLYEQNQNLVRARNKLKPYVNEDTIAYLISEWYKNDLLWDSSIMFLDSVIVRDSANSKAWWKKGRAYEERGWLSYSLKYFEEMLVIDPYDSMAIKRIDLIQRKIAYLQRQKFEESKVPVLELEPIKIKN